jgi:FMN reductase
MTGRPPDVVVDLCDLGADLLEWDRPGVAAAKAKVLDARDLIVVASPTYKGAYTGLLKLFLDKFAAGEIPDTPTVPIMMGAAMGHAMAPELVLRPVLVEIGASCPWPGLFLLDTDYETGPLLDRWLDRVAATGGARTIG